MKKKILIGSFFALILATVITTVYCAIRTYHYEVAHDDLLIGLGAAMVVLIGGFAVIYELDLFYTLLYFLAKQKTVARSILNIASNATLLSVVFRNSIARFLSQHVLPAFREEWIVLLLLLLIYVVLRVICAVIPTGRSKHED